MAEQKTYDRTEFDNDPVANALGGLKRVDAPKDFEFKVKARIAKGRPQDVRLAFPAWVKAAVPLGLLVMVGGFLGLRYAYEPANLVVPPVAAVEVPAVVQPLAPEQTVASVRANEQSAQTPAARPETARVTTTRKPSATKPAGGSIDSAVSVADQLELKDVALADALKEAGVRGTVGSGGVKVDAADARSGLKSGDVIESVGGRSVETNSTIKGRLAGKTLRVRRDGKVIEILVKN